MRKPKARNITLFRELAQGSETAYTELYSIYGKRLMMFIGGYLERDVVETEDVLANVMLTLWLQREQLGDMENPESRLYRIAKFQALDRRKRINRQRVELYQAQATLVSDLLTDSGLERDELTTQIWKASEKLTEAEFGVFLSTWQDGLTPEVIAKRKGTGVRTVYNQLYTARKKIGGELKEYFNELDSKG